MQKYFSFFPLLAYLLHKTTSYLKYDKVLQSTLVYDFETND